MRSLLNSLLCASAFATVYADNSTTVQLDGATVIGTTDGVVDQFLGIPFAQPPIGKLRLQLPQPVAPYTGVINATTFGNQCLQQTLTLPDLPSNLPPEIPAFLQALLALEDAGPPQSEDCLNINVIVPAGTTPDAKLPVAVVRPLSSFCLADTHTSCGFQIGSNAVEPGAVVVNRSIEIGQPTIFVAMNYRLSAFGFLGGREVQAAGIGNLGLQDQREALRWVQKYISAFGGDPTKVTIWGESAGAISVALHMITNGGNTEGLFRAGWMESGSVYPSADITTLQPTFDSIAASVGCASAPDVLECIREAPVDALKAASDNTSTILSFQGLNTPWFPRVDGVFLQDNPMQLVLNGTVAQIPIVMGNNEDEGTLFSLASFNITTDDEFAGYVKQVYFPNATDAEVTRLLELYPSDPAAGSPFGTGDNFTFTPEYKRLAAFQGDLIFQSLRRFLLDQVSDKQTTRSFLSERNKVTGVGAAHASELAIIFGGQDMTDFLIRFVNTLDPNGGPEIDWPAYTTDSRQLLAFLDGDTPLTLIQDTFRQNATDFDVVLSLEHPF
ncbi:carotenoid ester lipase precursor [Trametes cingulata]|nr:carotenoid ester lipase precursor [Trametes cingulata]